MAKNNHAGGKKLVGLGIATAAAVAGALFLYGTKKGKEIRGEVRGWALKMKGEVLEKLEDLKEVTEDSYYDVIDEVKTRYEAVKNIDPDEVMKVADDMKKHWKQIKKQYDAGKGGNGRVAKKIKK